MTVPYPEMQPNNLFETKTVFKVFFVAHRSQLQGDLEAIPLYQTLRRFDELHRLSSLAETNRFDLCLFPNYLNYSHYFKIFDKLNALISISVTQSSAPIGFLSCCGCRKHWIPRKDSANTKIMIKIFLNRIIRTRTILISKISRFDSFRMIIWFDIKADDLAFKSFVFSAYYDQTESTANLMHGQTQSSKPVLLHHFFWVIIQSF